MVFYAVCESGQRLYYNITSNTEPYTVCASSNNVSEEELTGDLIIPETVTYNDITYSVTGIGSFTNNSGLTSVSIPNSVTSGIDIYTFTYCTGLTSVTIGNSVPSIGNYAFIYCSNITSLTIGNSVSSIGDYAFCYCSGLYNVNIPNTVTSIGQFAFMEAKNIEYHGTATGAPWGALAVNGYVDGYLIYSNYTKTNIVGCSTSAIDIEIPNSVINIGNSAFSGCSRLTSIAIPNTVTSIGNNAFNGCSSMNSLTIGSSVSSIGINAFYNCGDLESIIVDSENQTYDSRDNCNALIKTNDNHLILGSGSSTIPANVIYIEDNAFYNCHGLSHITFPTSLTSIGGNAFSGCTGLTEITIPHSVTSIGSGAFSDCNNLVLVNYNAINCTVDGGLFYGCISLSNINIGNNVTYIPDNAFSGCEGLLDITFPNSLIGIGNYAFSGCSNIETINIPNNVITIGDYAFSDCPGLTSITIGESVTSIGEYAFYCQPYYDDYTGITYNEPSPLAEITYNTRNLQSPTWVFMGTTLNKLNIGDNVIVIPDGVFEGLYSIDTIVSLPVVPPAISENTFYYESIFDIPVIVPCRKIDIYRGVSYWMNFNNIQQDTLCPYIITVLSSNSDFGNVSGGGEYIKNTIAILTATPAEGYRFVNWSDGSTENPHNVIVTEDATYIATFIEIGDTPTIYNNIEATSCGSYIWNDQTYTESGEYYQTFTAANSADSIVMLNLTIYPIPEPEITIDGILDACNPESASVTLSTGEYNSYIWSNGETTSSIVVTTPDNYYVEVVDENGCHGFSEMTTVGYSSAITDAPQIRLVGMSSSGKNMIMWNVASTEGIAGYEIYREDSVANVYNCINRIERPSAHNYIDLTSEPEARAYRYKVCAIDECGGMSPMSDLHKTMHLTINRGVGTIWNLIWSHYEGLELSSYKIYRGTNPRDMVMIGEVPSTLNSFTDLTNTLEEGMYYRVEIVTNNGAKNDEVSLSSNIVANEFVDNYTITAFSNNVNFGTVSGSGTYPAELDITLAAIPNAGYEFVSWSDGNTENPRIITVTENATYIATFAEAAPIENYTITVVSVNPEYGTVTGGGTYPEGSVINIEAIANDGYRFVSWNDGNTDNPREITVMENATYEASFEEISPVANYTITAVSANPEYGTVTGGGTYAEGTVVSLTAEANEGYQFVQWSDGNTDNPREITVTGDAVYVALFAEVPPATTYTITAVSANPEYGTVTGGGTYAEGTVVSLTAEANEGYQFVQWSDGNTDNPREITVTGDAMYIATFAPATNISNIALPEISIFPNPTNDILNITSSEIISEIEIVNALGQVVYRTEVNADNVVCDVEGLTAGVYIVRIHGTDMASVIQKKFIKE